MWKGIWNGDPEGGTYFKYKRASGFRADVKQEKGLGGNKVKTE